MLASNAVSHLRVTIEASYPAKRERSENWKILTVSFTQSGFYVKKWSPRRRNSTVCVTRGALHLRAWALSLHAILKAGRAFYFVSGAKVFQIRGRSSRILIIGETAEGRGLQVPIFRRVFLLGGRCLSRLRLLDNVGWGRCGRLCARAWHQLYLQCLAADCDVIRQLKGGEGVYSRASLL